MESKTNEPLPTPPPYVLTDESKAGFEVVVDQTRSSFSAPSPPPPSSFSFSPGVDYATQTHTSLQMSATPTYVPRAKFVSYERPLNRSPGLITCPSCQTQVTTQVTFQVGIHAWLMCFVFVLFGLVLGCCLIPFFLDHFKDAYHTCPRCHLVLHVQKKTCCR